MVDKKVHEGDDVLNCTLSHPLLFLNLVNDLLCEINISSATLTMFTLKKEYQVLCRLCIELLQIFCDNLLDFRLEQGCLDIANPERDTRLDEIRHEPARINLILELDKSFQVIFQLRLQRLKPELVGDELGDPVIRKEHGKLCKLLQVILFDTSRD